jgi:hypothetical protein
MSRIPAAPSQRANSGPDINGVPWSPDRRTRRPVINERGKAHGPIVAHPDNQRLDARGDTTDDRRVAEVTPLPSTGSVFIDPRDNRRSMRLSWHAEAGVFVVSLWRDDACVASFPLAAAEAARFVHTMVGALAGELPVGNATTATGTTIR